MASPLKRIKLTPKKTHTPLRATQESRVTSTPKCSIESISSPNISNISSKSIKRRISDIFEEDDAVNIHRSPSVQSTSSTSTSDTLNVEKGGEIDYDDYFNHMGKLKYTGNIWKLYKPIKDKSLYGMILLDPANVQDIVIELLVFYERNPHQAMYLLIKFCVDVCGFQNFNVSSIYKFNENSAKKVISLLETEEVIDENPMLKNTNRYLLMESKGKLVEALKMGIYSFLQKFFFAAHEKGLLYNDFIQNFFIFVKCMSFSNLRCVHHTGVIFAIKFLTEFVKIESTIINDSNYAAGKENVRQILSDQKVVLDRLIEYFYMVFIKNCCSQDNRTLFMRVECIKELTVWISYFPKVFIDHLQAFYYLKKLMIDEFTIKWVNGELLKLFPTSLFIRDYDKRKDSIDCHKILDLIYDKPNFEMQTSDFSPQAKEVRRASVAAYRYLLQVPYVLEFLKPHMNEFREAMAKRFYDVDYMVAVGAIDIFTSLLRIETSLISVEIVEKVTNSLIFDQYFPIGEAACKFLGTYFVIYGYESQNILLKLAALSMSRGSCRPQLLIEGCLHVIPEVQDWGLFCSILFQIEEDADLLESLSTLLFESMFQTLKGKSSKKREKSRIVAVIDTKHHMKAAKTLSSLNKVLSKFRDHPKIFCSVLKCYTLINNDAVEVNVCKEYTDLCTIIEKQFFKEHEVMFCQMVDTLEYLCAVPSFSVRAKRFIENICERAIEHFMEMLSQPGKGDDLAFLRIALLYSKFNLNNKITWENLFDSCGQVHNTNIGHILNCCHWYLVWSLRALTEPLKKYTSTDFQTLQRHFNEFTTACFNMLKKLKGQKLHFEVYNTLCDFFIICNKELEVPIKTNKQFEKLRLKVADNQQQKLLTHFLDQYVIKNDKMSLNERRSYVVKYVNLVHENILPTESLGNVFKYYYSDNAEYEPIIEASLNEMTKSTDENTIFLVTLYTVTMVYDDIIDKHNAVDITTEEAKNLKLLVKQFLAHPYFRKPKRNFRKLLFLSIKYVLKKSHYSFLYFARYFTDLISDTDDLKEIYEYFCEKLPKSSERDDAVLFFANHLKNVMKSPSSRKGNVSGVQYPSENKENTPKAKKMKKTDNMEAKQQKPKTKGKQIEQKATKKSGVKSTGAISSKENKKKDKNKEKAKTDSETDVSDDLTIHDSDSDLEVSLLDLRI